MEENQEFTSLGSYIESIKPIVDSEYAYLKSNDWTKDDTLEESMVSYSLEEDIVSTAVGHIGKMAQYKKSETKLFKKWYDILFKFYEIHKLRADKFLGKDLEMPDGKADAKTKNLLAFRRTVSKQLALMNIIVNRSKSNVNEHDTKLPRIKYDTPIPIFFNRVMEEKFPILKTIVDKKRQDFYDKQDVNKKKTPILAVIKKVNKKK